MSVKEELISYYSKTSKHSNYQLLPSRLKSILGQDDLKTRSRFEEERLKFILQNVTVKQATVLDIGSNTGFFAFEILDAGAASMTCYEGNKEHAKFTELAARALDIGNLKVFDSYYDFSGDDEKYDVCLLLNILHHVGDDYGDKKMAMEEARMVILKQLNGLSQNVNTLVFQLGFNWHGDPARPLFKDGTKKEVIEFVKLGVKDHWGVDAIGIAEKQDGIVEYKNLNDKNIERDDSLGEFLNRPIFILESWH